MRLGAGDAVLAGDLGSVPRAHMLAHDLSLLLWRICRAGVQTDMQVKYSSAYHEINRKKDRETFSSLST